MTVSPVVANLAVEISSQPREIEQRLVAAVRSVALRTLDDPKVRAALAAAESIPVGIVLTSEDAAVGVVDAVRTIIDGEKVLAADLRDILRIPEAMEAAVRAAVADQRADLAKARERGNEARVAFQQEARRQAAAAEAKARAAAAAAAEAAAIEAIETGEDVPPPAEIAPVAVPRTITAGVAKSGTMVRMKAVEVVDFAAVPHSWIKLDTQIALAAFNGDAAQGKVKKPAPGESIVYQGVRFEAVESAVNR